MYKKIKADRLNMSAFIKKIIYYSYLQLFL